MSGKPRQLDPRQSITREPTDWEMALADAIEAAFGKGVHDLAALVTALNGSRVRPPGGELWTAENFTTIIHDLELSGP